MHPTPASPAAAVLPAAPHTTMSFLFTDIEGSTRRWEETPDAHGRIEEHFAALRSSVEGAGGEVFSTMGDGIAAAFTSAEAAVRAAIDAQRQMPPIGLAVRMGIHTGEVERVGDDFRGRPVNRAARLMAVGHGGQILLSDVSAAIVRTGRSPVDLIDLGTHRLRDLADLERVWQVVHPALERAFPPVRGLTTCSSNLPMQRSSLVGREQDVARVVALVQERRIVTLTGVGGVGKTRLAVQAAAELGSRFSRLWFVELACVVDPDDVGDAIARAVGAAAVADPLDAAASLLAGDEALLVVDNCEHVVESAATVIDQLMRACPNLTVIATSREAMSIEGEHLLAVRPLDPATAAVELFEQRAVAAGADHEAMERSLMTHVCRRLDGLPLAIELAAARAATLGLPAIVDGLDQRFSLLSGGRRRSGGRHGTMRATLDWSFRLLEVEEQRMLLWLAVFSNGLELGAAEHIAGAMEIDALAAHEHVASLVHKSLVSPEPHPQGMRYRMLETTRAFALEQLDERGERLAALTALAEWMTTITDLPFEDPCNAAVERNSIRLEREADNWRDAVSVAVQLGSGDLAARLCGPPVAFFLLGRHDLADCIRPLLELCGRDTRRRRAVLCALMVSAAGSTDAAQLQEWADEMQRIDDVEPTGLGGLMRWLALVWRGDFGASIDVCVQASRDLSVTQATRDMFVGIATLDHFSLTDATDDPHGLIERALEVASRSDVAIHRVTCLLGAAWGLAGAEPDRSLRLVRRALSDIANVPALTRVTLPGCASRLLARLDPSVAAQGLLEQLDERPTSSPRTFVDLIPLSYATELLQRVGHPSAGSALASMSVSPVAPYLSMMDFVDLARRVSSSSSLVSISELDAIVRSALTDIVNAPAQQPA